MLSLLVALCAGLLVAFTIPDYGLSADESFYMSIAKANTAWLLHPTWDSIVAQWPIHDRHPPIFKISGGITRHIFFDVFGLMNQIDAFRLGILPFVMLLSGTMTWFVSKNYGKWLGVYAGLTAILLPRVFYHAHLGALDFPITALWLATAVVSVQAVTSIKSYVVVLILLGISLATKLQGALLGVTVGSYITIVGLWQGIHSRRRFWILPLVLKTTLLVLIPLGIFLICWPYLWPDPIGRFRFYTSLMLEHYPIDVYYLGQQYTNVEGNMAPWHYSFVLLFTTIPLPVVIFGLVGIASALLKPRKYERFMLINLFVPLVMMTLPYAIQYDGERLFLPAYPFAVVMSVIGLDRFRRMIQTHRPIFPLTVLVLTIYVCFVSLRIHPYQYVYASELVGGVKGAQLRGYETEYWGSSYKAVIPFLQQHPTATYCVFPWPDLLKGYWYQGIVKEIPVSLVDQSTVYSGDFSSCDYAIILARQGFFRVNADVYWDYYKNKTPLFSETVDGVPLVSIYAIK